MKTRKSRMPFTSETTLVRVKKNSNYLRTPIPTAIKDLFQLDHGSKLTWVYSCKDGPKIVIIPSTGNDGGVGD
jgi:hypothetical protein